MTEYGKIEAKENGKIEVKEKGQNTEILRRKRYDRIGNDRCEREIK